VTVKDMDELLLFFSRDALIYLKSLLAGLAVSIPFGPASVLAIRRTLQRGFMLGLFSALGIVIADTIWGTLTGFGLTSLTEGIVELLLRLQRIGGGALMCCGILLFLRRPPSQIIPVVANSPWRSWLATFGITLANPFIPVLFAAAFASLGLDNFLPSVRLLGWMIAGILSGTILWWCFLCGIITLLHRQVKTSAYAWLNRLSGLLLMVFGLYAMLSTGSK
jgi:threonine/homoserine/homoserine lactone efflux protein